MTRVGHFLSCDWGTTRFRVRVVSRDADEVVASMETEDGVKNLRAGLMERGQEDDATLRAAAFEAVLARAIDVLGKEAPAAVDGASVVISGMASSTLGWRELPYARTPCALDGSSLVVAPLGSVWAAGSSHAVWMVSGLSTGTDIMRGEETELLGVLSAPGQELARRGSLVVLPGTHAKHVRVEDGAVVDFRTYVSGELLELFSTRSLLGASVEWPPGEWDRESFRAGLDEVATMGLARALFRVRTRTVLDSVPRAANSWYLAGLVLGAEVAGLVGWEGTQEWPIVLAASEKFTRTYRMAIEHAGAGERVRVVAPRELLDATLRAQAMVLDRCET